MENSTIEPTIAISLINNWIQLNVRFITDYKRRRNRKNTLYKPIEIAIFKTHGKVTLASTMLQ